MGWYIEVPENLNKAKQIEQIHGGQIVSFEQAKEAIKDPSKGVIIVMRNPFFEAAGFAYDQEEFDAFTSTSDTRTKWFVVLPRKLAKELSHYPRD